MGHGCHDCGSPNSCECPELVALTKAELTVPDRGPRAMAALVRECKSERDALRADLESLKAENERLRADLLVHRSAVSELQNDVDDLMLRDKPETTLYRFHEWRQRAETAEATVAALTTERDAARAEVARLKSFSMALGSIANGMARRHPSDPSKHELLALFEAELDAALADNIRSPSAESGTKEVALAHDKTEGT